MNRIMFAILAPALMIGANTIPVAEAYAGITSVTHKVVRSDGSKASSEEKHEFNGGSRDYFKTVDEPGTIQKWIEEKTEIDAYQEGWTRLYLDWPVTLRSITLHRASTGDKKINNGWVKLEVQTTKGQWVTVFERLGQDVKSAVTISKELQKIGPTKGVRLVFKSPASMSIGPIDLNF